MIIIGIVEDQQENIDLLSALLEQCAKTENRSFQYHTFSSAEEYLLHEGKIDILFLDIGLPKMDGMALAKQIREKDPDLCIIFTTSLRQYAIEGYEVNAHGFLLKPVTYYPLAMALNRALRHIDNSQQGHLIIKRKTGPVYIPLKDILYLDVRKHTTYVHTEKEVIETYAALSDLESKLPKDTFVRTSGSSIVNVKRITNFAGEDLLVGDEVVLVSRRFRKTVLDAIVACFGGN